MKAAHPIITVVIMTVILTALAGSSWYILSNHLETKSQVILVPLNRVSCDGTTASFEIRNMGSLPVNNSDHKEMLGLFPDDATMLVRWNFGEEDGAATFDSSGNKKHGSVYGDTVLLMHFDEGSGTPQDSTSFSAPVDITGHEPTWQLAGCQSGKCMEFDGSGDYIVIGTGSDFSDVCVNGCTFSNWMKLNNDNSKKAMLARFDDDNDDRFFLWHVDQGLVKSSIYEDGGSTKCEAQSDGKISLDTWYHVVSVYDESNVIVYINGIRNATSPNCAFNYINGVDWGDDESTFIGVSDETDLDYHFSGTIDEVAVYDHALTDTEVEDLYLLGKARFIERASQGRIGYGIEFGGDGDRVNPADIELTNIDSKELTYSAWIKTSQPNGIIMERGDDSAGVQMVVNGGLPRFSYRWSSGVNDLATVFGSNPVNDGKWHHIMGIVRSASGGQIEIYVDGFGQSQNGVTMMVNNPAEGLGVGSAVDKLERSSPVSISDDFEGIIDEVIIWERNLIESEIQDQMAPTCSCTGQVCSCGDLQVTRIMGKGEFQPFFDSETIEPGGTLTLTDYGCQSDTCGYRIVSIGSVEEIFADCK